MTSVTRYHDISCGHRVVGHESKCKNLHGHNYRFHFHIRPKFSKAGVNGGLDEVGRVLDFGVIKSILCNWLEVNWDHKMLLWEMDPIYVSFTKSDLEGVVTLPFNPTAENIAEYFVTQIAPKLLEKTTGTELFKLTIDETRKCSVTYEL